LAQGHWKPEKNTVSNEASLQRRNINIMAKLRIALLLCFMMAATASLASASSSSSLSSSSLARSSLAKQGLNTMVLRAREWLRTHEDPDQAGMDELKNTNPDAFAIVQALMTKKSLGLLNPKHPNAFGGYQGAPEKGDMSTTVVEDAPSTPVAAASTETQHASGQDFLNWKPHDDDDSMVSNVLGEVASLTGNSVAAPVKEASAPVEVAQPQPEPQKTESVKVVAPIASMSQANSYLNSAGMDQPKEARVAVPKGNALSGFSWNDDDSAPAKAVAPQPKIPGGNALESFLR